MECGAAWYQQYHESVPLSNVCARPQPASMSAIITVSLLLTCTVAVLLAAPSTYHDQRQNGEYNLHSHLENFIVVLIPTSSLSSSSWLDFAKRLRLQDHLKYVRDDKTKASQEVAAPAILDKTPYTVDVEIKTARGSPLSRLHPAPVLDVSPEVMIALSPSVSLSRSSEEATSTDGYRSTSVKPPPAPEKADEEVRVPEAPERATEAAALQPPEVKPLEEPARMVKKAKSILSTSLERVEKGDDLRLKLLGAGIEICSSNERRGEDGNCEPIKARRRSGEFFAPSGLLPSLRFGLSPANN